MSPNRIPALAAALALAGLLLPGPAAAQDFTDADCATCHDGSDAEIPLVIEASLEGSIHEGFGCMGCHGGIDDLPHHDVLPRVECGACHDDAVEDYTRHGRGLVGETEDLPGCADCHGSHDILPSGDPASRVHSRNLPGTCAGCHEDLDLVRKHHILIESPVERFETSVHGRAVRAGNENAPTCIDCHSAEGTSHRILSPGEFESSINHFQIPNTCGKCHSEETADYWEGVHGQLALRGRTNTPVCTDCHGEHGILPPSDPRSNLSPIQVASATCEPCHEAARLNERYGRTAGVRTTFIDSFHGLKSRAGDPTVANCASCHGAHKVLPSTHPESSVHPSNLRTTCGSCHPGISSQLAGVPIHGPGFAESANAWTRLFRKIYVWLIGVVIGGMFLYVVLDFRKSAADLRKAPPHRVPGEVRRMSRHAVLQHAALTLSFTVLVVSGFALRYSDAWLFRTLFGWDGGFAVRGTIHRVAGVVLIASALWHLLYLRTPEGRSFFTGMVPVLRDVSQALGRTLYNLGLKKSKPAFGRFSYVEKAEYWALIWGTVVMAATGLLLWFDNAVVRFLPTTFLEVMRVIHFYEAWLATLAILVWHLYGVLFQPGVYPGNPAWLTGKMPREMYEHEHPADLETPGDPSPNPEEEGGETPDQSPSAYLTDR